MAKAQRKTMERLRVRRAHFDNLGGTGQRGRKRPGSMKKSQPIGKR